MKASASGAFAAFMAAPSYQSFFPVRSAVCFFVEGGIILVSVMASFFILRGTATMEGIELRDAVFRGIVIAFLCQVCMYMLDMYDLKNSQSWGEIFFSLLFALGVVCIGIGSVSLVFPAVGIGGPYYYLTITIIAVFLLVWRVVFDFYLTHLAPRENILIMGAGPEARMVAREIQRRRKLGFHLVGFTGSSGGEGDGLEEFAGILGIHSQVADIVKARKIRKLVVATTERRREYPIDELLRVRVGGCQIVEWPAFFERLSGRVPIDNLAPSYFIFHEGFGKSTILLLSRRFVSLIVSATLLVLLIPLLLVVAAAIKIDSAGPVLYVQDRVGQHGRVFRIFKFRSMRQDAENGSGPRWAAKEDPRTTRVGRAIRLSRIDEIPQLFNVLRGDINLVGPRPERPEFVRKLEETIPYYSIRHTVKPGLTGWAQVMFTYCGTIAESKEKLQYDLFYIKNMSLKLDLLILFQTVKIVLIGRGAR